MPAVCSGEDVHSNMRGLKKQLTTRIPTKMAGTPECRHGAILPRNQEEKRKHCLQTGGVKRHRYTYSGTANDKSHSWLFMEKSQEWNRLRSVIVNSISSRLLDKRIFLNLRFGVSDFFLLFLLLLNHLFLLLLGSIKYNKLANNFYQMFFLQEVENLL